MNSDEVWDMVIQLPPSEGIDMNYDEFLTSKIKMDVDSGFNVPESEINPALFAFQKDVVQWACRGGQACRFC